MAMILKCDRCGAEMKDPKQSYVIQIGARGQMITCRPESYDLCESCLAKVTLWLEGEKK